MPTALRGHVWPVESGMSTRRRHGTQQQVGLDYRLCSSKLIRRPDGRVTTIPHHKGRMLARPLIREILREIKITVEQYNELLDR